MITAVWNKLWQMHDETKDLFLFRPQAILEKAMNVHFSVAQGGGSGGSSSSSSDSKTGGGDKKEEEKVLGPRQKAGLIIGPALFIILGFLMPRPEGMSAEAQRMAGVAGLMASWWMCESIPIPATSLLPIALFPLLGIMHTKKACAPFASHLIYLFMGGFIIALAMSKWGLHRRIAMNIVKIVGFAPGRLIFGFMAATAVLSAFVSNTATTVMMLPIGLAIIAHVVEEGKKEGLDKEIDFTPGNFNFGTNLMLGIAYGATIGGYGTLIGSPPNTVMAGYMRTSYGFDVTFLDWMKIGVPLVVVMLPIAWFWLTKVINPIKLKKVPGGSDLIEAELKEMGPMSTGERWVALVFFCTALGWMFRKKIGFLFPNPKLVTDAAIAISGAMLLFLIPINLKKGEFVMDWASAAKMPWGVLLLFGGGLSMAGGFKASGLAKFIGSQVGLLQGASTLVLIIACTILVCCLTEMTSNTATAAMAMPILSAVAIGLGENPLLLALPAALAASCAFTFPVATPPNAIVFSSGYIAIPKMAKSGIGLDCIGMVCAVTVTMVIAIPVFGVVLGEVPTWALK